MRDSSRDVWVPSEGAAIPGSFHNATRAAELEAMGLVPARIERRATVMTAEKSKSKVNSPSGKGPEWKAFSKAKKREWLLSHPTLSDASWAEEERRVVDGKRENREAFIRRVLS